MRCSEADYRPLKNKVSVLKNNLESINKIVLAAIIVTSIAVSIRAQNQAQYLADSIISLLDTIPNPKDQIYFLKENGRNFLRSNDSVSFLLNQKTIDIGINSSNPHYLGLAYEEKGVLLSILNLHESARSPIKQSIKYFRESNDSTRIGYGYRNLGITYSFTQQYDSAVTHFFNSLTYLTPKKEDDLLFYGLTLLELAKSFTTTEAYRAALKYADLAIEVLSQIDRPYDLAGAYNTKSIALMNLPNHEFPDHYIEEVLKYAVERQDTGSYIVHLHNYGLFLRNKKKYESALDTLIKGLELSKKYERRNLIPYYKNTIGEIYVEQGQLDKAKPLLESVINEYKVIKDASYNPYQRANLNMSDIKFLEGRYKEAYEHLKISRELERDILKLENEKLIELYERELEFIEKDKALIKVTHEKEQQALKLKENQRLFYFLFIIIVCLLIILFTIYYFNQKLKSKREEIEAKSIEILSQKEELEKTNTEKENLLSIIGHDMRGPLGNLSQLIEIVLSDDDNLSDDSKHAMKLMKGSSDQMVHLLNNLLLWAKAEKSKLSLDETSVDLVNIVNNVANLYEATLDFNQIKLNLILPEALHVKTDGDAIETILRNLLNNAIKFSSANSNITISAFKDTEGYSLSIEDEAGGISKNIVQEIFNTKDREISYNIKKGFGLKLCKEIIDLINAKWAYKITDKGCIITVIITEN